MRTHEPDFQFLVETLEARNMLSTVNIFATGTTNQEIIELEIGGQSVATYSNLGSGAFDGQFQTRTFTTADRVTADDVRIRFTNDLFDEAGGTDRNVRIDAIEIDGVRFETEDSSVFSTGTFVNADGIVPGFGRGEILHTNGFFQFAGGGGITTPITVNARGTEGTESFALQIDGQTVEVFDNISTNFSSYNFEATGNVTADQIRVVFLNDQYDPANGIDSNLVVDDIVVGGVQFETEASNVFSSGTFLPEDGIAEGFGRGDTLHVNGFFEFSSQAVSETPNVEPPAEEPTVVEPPVVEPPVVEPPVVEPPVVEEPPTPAVEPAPAALSSGDGLFAEYFRGVNFNDPVREGIESEVDFNFGRSSPDGLPNDNFSIRFSGQVEALYSELYTFETTSDDGIRLFVNDELIIDNFTNHRATIDTGTIQLEAGVRYDIRLEYFERTGSAIVQLRWRSESQSREIISQSQLYSGFGDETPTPEAPVVEPTAPAEEPPVVETPVQEDVEPERVGRVLVTYFVSPNGSDNFDAEQAQDRATPFQSIQRAVDAARAGDTVIVLDGTYSEEVFLRHSGTAEQEITIEAENPQGVRLLGFIHGRDVSYITVDGFDVTNSNENVITQGIVFFESHHITISNNLVRDSFGGGIAFNQSDSILIEGNTTSGNAFFDPDAHSGISVYQPQRREDAEGEYGVIIRNNLSYENFNMVGNQNCCNGRPTDGNGIVLDDFQNSQDGGNGIDYDRRTLVENNITHSNGGNGIHVFRSHEIDIRNNTSVGNVINLNNGAQINVSSSRDVNVYNNIVSALTDENAVRTSNSSRVTLEFNVIDGPAVGFSNDSSNFFDADPGFRNDSFELTANSVAIDQGRDLDDAFEFDALGQDRVVDRIDIGAVERQS